MSPKNQLKAWTDRMSTVSNALERESYRDFLNHVQVGEDNDDQLMDESVDSRIGKFYENKSVLITGATGFVGKSIVEKLLRSCPKVREVFLLIRPKKSITSEKRLEEILEVSLFNRIHAMEDGKRRLAKIRAITGDITKPLLGISGPDLAVISARVNVIINAAASVNFNAPIVDAAINVVSVDELIDVAMGCQNLVAVIHISTCFANCISSCQDSDEKFPKVPMDPRRFIALAKSKEKLENLQQLEQYFKQDSRPNTYTFTKAIADHLFKDRCSQLNSSVYSSIVRLSVVCSSWREPFKGWVDNHMAATGVLLSLAGGYVGYFNTSPDNCLDLIPVDMVANIVISSAWAIATKPHLFPSTCIFNASSGSLNRANWDTIVTHFTQLAYKFPYDKALREPSTTLVPDRRVHKILSALDLLGLRLHNLYYRIIATIMFTHKPKELDRMLKLCKRYRKLHRFVSYFTRRNWSFHSANSRRIYEEMSSVDRTIFHFAVSDIDWPSYLRSYYVGSK